MTAEEILTAGGVGTLLIAVTYVGRLSLDWWQAKRTGDDADDRRPVTNAATANEVLLNTLKAITAENERVSEQYVSVVTRLGQIESDLSRERMIRERLAKRTDEHDREIGRIKRQFALAVTYIRSLLALLSEHDLEAPEPPTGLHLD